jgi:hypothetical protein
MMAAGPVLTELRPRGAKKGSTVTLTLVGANLDQGTEILTTLPATFTPLTPGMKGLPYLLELKEDAAAGTYPVRVKTAHGISNVLLFTVGEFPEIESKAGSTIATAQAVTAVPVTINGKLLGADRNDFKIAAKAGQRLVFEVEARRCGSAIDPALTLFDAAGKRLAHNEDAPGIGVDSRLDYTFARDGEYIVQVNDARFSRQEQNFYRLKIGAYNYPEGVFPLGGKRGEKVALEFASNAGPVRTEVKLPEQGDFTTVAMPGSPALPFRFALSEYPELRTPVAGALPVPAVVNGRIEKPAQVDRFTMKVTPGESLLFEMQSRELGASMLDALITIRDAKGAKLASAGDVAPPDDVFSLQTGNRTSNDPYLGFKVPAGVTEIAVSVEDIAQRGGPGFGYRMTVKKQAEDFRLSANPAYVNVPRGGTVQVVLNADRRGYDGPIHARIPNLPKGWTAEGGFIAAETVDSTGARSFSRRGVLTLTASKDAEMPTAELAVIGEGKIEDGTRIERRAAGAGMVVDVASGTGLPDAASSDRQKPFTAPWLGMALPVSMTDAASATLEVAFVDRTAMEQGDAYNFRWKIETKNPGIPMPGAINADAPGLRDIRVINMKATQKGAATGTFTITTTKATTPARYDLIASAVLMVNGVRETIMARAITFDVVEGGSNETSSKSPAGDR